jgi:hypothetical protein
VRNWGGSSLTNQIIHFWLMWRNHRTALVGNDEHQHDQLYCHDEIAIASSHWRRRSVADGMKRYGRAYWRRAPGSRLPSPRRTSGGDQLKIDMIVGTAMGAIV